MATYRFTTKSGISIPVPVGVTLRRGQASDLDSITRLSLAMNFIEGGDYMPGLWLRWVVDPKKVVVVAVKDGEVVAVQCLFAFQGGKYLNGCGTRSHPKLRGAGIYKALNTYNLSEVLDEFPQADEVFGVSIHPEYLLSHHKVTDAGRRIRIFQKASLQEIEKATKILKVSMNISTTNIHREDKGGLQKVLANQATCRKIFPTGYFNLAFETYPATHMLRLDDIWKDYRNLSLEYSDNEVTSASFGGSIPCPAGTCCYFEYYGNTDMNVMFRHFLDHAENMPQYHAKYGGEIFLWIMLPKGTDIGAFTDILLGTLGFQKSKHDVKEVMCNKSSMQAWRSKL